MDCEVVSRLDLQEGSPDKASTSQEHEEADQSAGVVPVTSRKRKAEESWGFATARNVLSLAADKYLKTTDASNGFVQYLKRRNVEIVDVQAGSLIITVECSSVRMLDKLWEEYLSGRVNKEAHKFLVTKEILNELGLRKVKLKTTIPKEEYSSYRQQLRYFGLGEFYGLLQTRFS